MANALLSTTYSYQNLRGTAWVRPAPFLFATTPSSSRGTPALRRLPSAISGAVIHTNGSRSVCNSCGSSRRRRRGASPPRCAISKASSHSTPPCNRAKGPVPSAHAHRPCSTIGPRSNGDFDFFSVHRITYALGDVQRLLGQLLGRPMPSDVDVSTWRVQPTAGE